MAPDIFVHVALSGLDCHWYVTPQFVLIPVALSVVLVEAQLVVVGLAEAVPPVGVPLQSVNVGVNT